MQSYPKQIALLLVCSAYSMGIQKEQTHLPIVVINRLDTNINLTVSAKVEPGKELTWHFTNGFASREQKELGLAIDQLMRIETTKAVFNIVYPRPGFLYLDSYRKNINVLSAWPPGARKNMLFAILPQQKIKMVVKNDSLELESVPLESF